MKKLATYIFAVFLVISFFSFSYADENDQGLDAAELAAIVEAVQLAMDTGMVIEYDYCAPEGMSKTFSRAGTSIIVTWESGTETWTYTDGSRVEYLFEDGFEIGRREYNTSGVMTQDLTYFPPIQGIDLSGPKKINKSWGGGYIAKKPNGSLYGVETKMFTIIGVEDITVPAGTFINCSVVYNITGTYDSVAWYAEGIGMIKQLGVYGEMLLDNYTP